MTGFDKCIAGVARSNRADIEATLAVAGQQLATCGDNCPHCAVARDSQHWMRDLLIRASRLQLELDPEPKKGPGFHVLSGCRGNV